jgi:hypothetical protein
MLRIMGCYTDNGIQRSRYAQIEYRVLFDVGTTYSNRTKEYLDPNSRLLLLLWSNSQVILRIEFTVLTTTPSSVCAFKEVSPLNAITDKW